MFFMFQQSVKRNLKVFNVYICHSFSLTKTCMLCSEEFKSVATSGPEGMFLIRYTQYSNTYIPS